MASSMVVGTIGQYPADKPTTIVIPVVCTAHTDGTFETKQITKAEVGLNYTKQGFCLAHMIAVNDATTYPGSGAVTITDSIGQTHIGSAVSDAFTLSTAASGVAHLSATRIPLMRQIVGLLSIAITDTGSAANILTLYIVLAKNNI
jgi:hypothetical protein